MNDTIENILIKKSTLTKTPIKGSLELSPVCNMNCKMCYVHEKYEDVSDAIKPVDFWLNLIPAMKEKGVLFLTLIGGEPFAYNGVDVLYKELIKNGFYVNITTNGVLLSETIPNWLLELPPRYITVSMYGASDETYYKVTGIKDGYTKVMKAISKLKYAGIPLKINYCVVPENKNDVEEIICLAEELNVPIVATSYCFPSNSRKECEIIYPRLSAKDAAEKYWDIKQMTDSEEYVSRLKYYAKEEFKQNDYKATRNFYCNAGTCNFWIDWKGNLTSCGLLNEPGINLEYRDFGSAWVDLTVACKKVETPVECVLCRYREICEVCPAVVKAETGTFENIPEYVCAITKNKVEVAKERIEQLG